MAQQRRLINAAGFDQEQAGGQKVPTGDPAGVPDLNAPSEWKVPPDTRLRVPPSGGESEAWDPTARDRTKPRDVSVGGGMSNPTPTRPRQPVPAQGSVSAPPPQGVVPFEPMGEPAMASLASPAAGGLFGSLGGLRGGGLGVPLDPINDAQGDQLSALIAMLMGRG